MAWMRSLMPSVHSQSDCIEKAFLDIRTENRSPVMLKWKSNCDGWVFASANQKEKVHRSLIWVNSGKGDIQSSMQKWEKIKLKTSLLLIFFRLLFFLLPKQNRRLERVYRTSTKCIHTVVFLQVQMNYITIVSRTDFFPVLSLTHTQTSLNAFAFKQAGKPPSRCCCLLQMYLLKEFFLMLCSVCPIQVVWRIDCPLDTHRSIDFLTEKCARRRENGKTRKAALLRLIWIFVSLCKSSLLIGGAFFLARRPSILIFFSFSLLMPLLCSYTSAAATRVCSSLSAHLSRWGGKDGERGSEKNFRKTNCWKKKKWYREKECIQPPRWRRERARKKNVKEKIVLPRTDDEYTNIFKKRNM